MESAALAPIVFESFFDSQSQNTVFSIRCISTTHDKNLVSAIKGKSHDLLKQSLRNNNARGFYALELAARQGDVESVKIILELLNRGPGNFIGLFIAKALRIKFNLGDNCLLGASTEGYIKIVQALLEAGVDVNARIPDGKTALMLASQKGHAGVVQALLEAGADVNKLGPNSGTALMIASEKGHIKILKALIQAGADLNARSTDGWTALMLASKAGHVEIAKALIEAGAGPERNRVKKRNREEDEEPESARKKPKR